MKSGVTDFLIDTAGFSSSTISTTELLDRERKALWVLAIRAGKSEDETELCETYAETISVTYSSRSASIVAISVGAVINSGLSWRTGLVLCSFGALVH